MYFLNQNFKCEELNQSGTKIVTPLAIQSCNLNIRKLKYVDSLSKLALKLLGFNSRICKKLCIIKNENTNVSLWDSLSEELVLKKTILNIALLSFIHLSLSIWNSILYISGNSITKTLYQQFTRHFPLFLFMRFTWIYYLPKSFTTYITKQYEIITLIIIRKLFKDLSLQLTSNWFEIKGDLKFTYDIVASILLFYLIFNFKSMENKIWRKTETTFYSSFVKRKKIIVLLLPLFSSWLPIHINWVNGHSISPSNYLY
jgi:hypothetical protein